MAVDSQSSTACLAWVLPTILPKVADRELQSYERNRDRRRVVNSASVDEAFVDVVQVLLGFLPGNGLTNKLVFGMGNPIMALNSLENAGHHPGRMPLTVERDGRDSHP